MTLEQVYLLFSDQHAQNGPIFAVEAKQDANLYKYLQYL